MRGFLEKYFFILKGHAGSLAGMASLFLALSMLDLVGVGLIGPFVGAILEPTALDRLPPLRDALTIIGGPSRNGLLSAFGAVLLVLVVTKGALAFFVHRRILSFSFGFRTHLIRRLMGAYLRAPYGFYLERNSSTIVNSIVFNTKVMTDDLLIPSLRLVSDSLMFGALVCLLLWVSPSAIALLLCMLGTSFVLYVALVRPRVRRAGAGVASTNEAIIRGVNQGIWGIKEIRTLQVEQAFYDKVAHAAELHSADQLRFNACLVVPRYLMETTIVLFVVVFCLYAITRGDSSASLIPVLAMFGIAGVRMLPALTQVSSSLASMNYSSFALHELYRDLKHVEPQAAAVAPGATAPRPSPEFSVLRLHDVSYSYPGSAAKALDGVTLDIRRGRSIGIIGASGAGKTTLVDLILGLHPRDAGGLDVDGVDIEAYGWSRWLSGVAYIPQNALLIDDTVLNNVAFGVPDGEIDHERVRASLGFAQLSAVVEKMPKGLHTVLGERGVKLSGGERQRLALARALYHNREVLVLDEATSALDTETEREVISFIEGLHGSKTLIVIAHRLSTVATCDEIHRLQAGRLVSSGSFEEIVGAQHVA